MSRKEIIQKGFEKTKKVCDRMTGNRDLSDMKETVKITEKLSLEVNCYRGESIGIQDDGQPLSLEIYAIVNGEDTDVCTIDDFRTIDKYLMYLLTCYV